METPLYTTYPVLPIRNTVLFPGVTIPLRVGRRRSVAALAALKDKPWAVIVTQKNGTEAKDDPTAEDLYRFGTLVKIETSRGSPEQGFSVVVRGIARFRIDKLLEGGKYLEAEGAPVPEQLDIDDKTAAALLESLKKSASEVLALIPGDTSQLAEFLASIEDLELLANLVAGNIEATVPEKQAMLENLSVKSRVLRLLDLLVTAKDNLEIQGQIREKLSHKLGKNQRENLLREQMRTIREELGEQKEAELGDKYRQKIEEANLPAEAKKAAEDELEKLEAMGKSSPESHVIRNYLDLLLALPWSKSADTVIDLDAARRTLDDDHFGLDKVKKRVLQHLAVMKLKPEGKGTILLFAGPPGVGKTSLGQSIAKALGRPFVRASLGGVRDDSEIRGHRRTYVGALPGRIIQSLKRAGVNNPVMMLDEIDKLGLSYQGDPAAALLEVLDPEQNNAFTDHYVDLPFDLSKVVFIATANEIGRIPGPLLDRMEVIELSGYTTAEKLHIARKHLVPKQLGENGLKTEEVAFGDETLLRLIQGYTREAGVRDLQRKIAELARSQTENVLNAREKATANETESDLPLKVSPSTVEDVLGPERFIHEVAERAAQPGVVTGLAWTPVGGDILFLEAELMPGSGRLTITGQLGDVMKESAQIALSLVRSRLGALVPGFDFAKNDLHLHVPAGAIPKDGPSAGVTMLTAIASLFTGRRVSPTLAMTGEITLRGAVLPVGGIKEKVIAAHRAGAERVMLPKRNEKDLRDVPEEVRSALKFEFAENAGDVLRITLGLPFEPVRLAFDEETTASAANPAASA